MELVLVAAHALEIVDVLPQVEHQAPHPRHDRCQRPVFQAREGRIAKIQVGVALLPAPADELDEEEVHDPFGRSLAVAHEVDGEGLAAGGRPEIGEGDNAPFPTGHGDREGLKVAWLEPPEGEGLVTTRLALQPFVGNGRQLRQAGLDGVGRYDLEGGPGVADLAPGPAYLGPRLAVEGEVPERETGAFPNLLDREAKFDHVRQVLGTDTVEARTRGMGVGHLPEPPE